WRPAWKAKAEQPAPSSSSVSVGSDTAPALGDGRGRVPPHQLLQDQHRCEAERGRGAHRAGARALAADARRVLARSDYTWSCSERSQPSRPGTADSAAPRQEAQVSTIIPSP